MNFIYYNYYFLYHAPSSLGGNDLEYQAYFGAVNEGLDDAFVHISTKLISGWNKLS